MTDPDNEQAETEDLTRGADYDAQSDLALPTTANDGETPDDGFVPGIGSVLPDPEGGAAYDMDRDIGV